ncbi:uncharacterized protein RAG0_04255 [Rhynchosporium agropyri]|uniref:Uncharacterized protein n=1 Tax=Rhynchosporium agropyri TaxID=914238 RepID=A0A1E1K800_9HELO|nr:uncharacterized protein RAG0_04255 [Rhynchosporium agropyri]
MAMKAHRRSHDTARHELLGSPAHKHVSTGVVHHLRAEARICDSSLLLPTNISGTLDESYPSTVERRRRDLSSFWIRPKREDFSALGIEFRGATEIETHENKQGSICCDHFYIEFRVDFQSYGKAGNALFVTRWMDIGEGRDYDDHKFKIRFLSPWISPWNRVKADFGRGFQARFDLNAVRGERSVQESTSLRPEKKDVDISVREQNFVAMNGRLVLTPRYLVLRASEYERGEDSIYCMRSRYGEIFG